MRSTTSRDAATKPPSEPSVFDSVPTRTTVSSRPVPAPIPASSARGREVGAEDGVGLIEDEERAVAVAEGDELVERGGVAVHGEDGVGDDDGRMARLGVGWRRRPSSSCRGAPCRGAGRRRGRNGTAGSRR